MPELLSPAGDRSSLITALDAGADAVYFGVKGLNMRHGAGNFDVLELPRVMDTIHESGAKGYLALNVIVYDRELERVERVLRAARDAGVDAVILWDMAVLDLARELGLAVHISTQASVSNLRAVRAYSDLGAERVVLARECALEDIRRISAELKREGPGCGIETFIHGAMCVSVSGRCFLSQYSFGRSANRGDCLQPCRREYTISETDPEGGAGYVLGEDYVMSPGDICAMPFIDKLIEAGIDSFKIEGRMRSPEYVGVVTACYRKAMDAYSEGKLDEELKRELTGRLRGVFNRGFSSGFYFGRPRDLGAEPARPYEKIFIGEVLKFYKKISVAEVRLMAGGIRKGDRLLICGRGTPAFFMDADQMEIEHRRVSAAEQGSSVGLKVPFMVRRNDKVFLWRES